MTGAGEEFDKLTAGEVAGFILVARAAGVKAE